MTTKKKRLDKFGFLKRMALEKGAVRAEVIPASEIVVENRVVLKCKAGCPQYGKKLMCPPYAPTVDEFREMLKEYRYALLAKFETKAEADSETARNYLRFQFDPEATEEQKEKISKFISDYNKDRKRIHSTVLELEKAAFNQGYPLAMGFTVISCFLCEKCDVKSGLCIYPTMARYPEHAVGVNVRKTAEKAGMTIRFPFVRKPEPTVLLLID